MAAKNPTKAEQKARIRAFEKSKRTRLSERERMATRYDDHDSDDDGCLSLEFCSRPVK